MIDDKLGQPSEGKINKTNEIPLWQFSRAFEGDMDKLSMDRVLDTLVASNYIKILKRPGIGTTILILEVWNEIT